MYSTRDDTKFIFLSIISLEFMLLKKKKLFGGEIIIRSKILSQFPIKYLF